MTRTECEATGLSSLFLDGNEGTDAEQHVFFCDVDSLDGVLQPAAFLADLAGAMREFRVPMAWLLRTQKGLHVFSPYLAPRRITERFEERLEVWGSDGFHRFMSYRNGQSILRVTAKPGERGGPLVVRSVKVPVQSPRDWSWPHLSFMRQLHPLMGRASSLPGRAMQGTGNLRLERYHTTAEVPT